MSYCRNALGQAAWPVARGGVGPELDPAAAGDPGSAPVDAADSCGAPGSPAGRPGIWAQIFGTGAASLIPNTYEWTYESFTSSLKHHPSGWVR